MNGPAAEIAAFAPADPAETVNVSMAEHPFAPVTVTVYEPGQTFEIELVVAPLDQLYV